MDRKQRRALAESTVQIIESGLLPIFDNDGLPSALDISEQIQTSVERTCSYPPGSYVPPPLVRMPTVQEEGQKKRNKVTATSTTYTLVNTTTLRAAKALKQRIDPDRKVAVLNFASANNPGGGFLRGSMAQEESLALNTGMYACIRNDKMYETHRSMKKKKKGSNNGGKYTDWTIFSPDVPVFRDEDDGSILDADDQFVTSILTCPCINRQHTTAAGNELKLLLQQRIIRMLTVLAAHHDGNLVLGAWGCGVFKNDPFDIARLFARILQRKEFLNRWPHVVFAVLDQQSDAATISAFRQGTGTMCGEIVDEDSFLGRND